MLRISTVGLLQLSHQARAAALTVKSLEIKKGLENAADTLMSAAALLLRYEEGDVPLDVAHAVNFVNDHLPS